MTRFLLKRIGLALITLFLLSVIVFAVSSILPGNVGRAVLGPFATQDSVDALNEQLGANRTLFVQYTDWAGGILHGDLGMSLTKQVPTWDLLGPALTNSLKLALVAFVLCVPLSILGGVIAALRYGKLTDKSITATGISLAAMPDFVTGIVLILVFSIWLGWLPVTAQAEDGASMLTQVKYLLLPAMTLTVVLFGYIARITRAGVIEALDSDYTRTAYLKGLPSGVVSQARAAQRAAADDRGRRRPDRLPLRRARRRRVSLQLPGYRRARPRGRAAEGPAAADGGCSRRSASSTSS